MHCYLLMKNIVQHSPIASTEADVSWLRNKKGCETLIFK